MTRALSFRRSRRAASASPAPTLPKVFLSARNPRKMDATSLDVPETSWGNSKSLPVPLKKKRGSKHVILPKIGSNPETIPESILTDEDIQPWDALDQTLDKCREVEVQSRRKSRTDEKRALQLEVNLSLAIQHGDVSCEVLKALEDRSPQTFDTGAARVQRKLKKLEALQDMLSIGSSNSSSPGAPPRLSVLNL